MTRLATKIQTTIPDVTRFEIHQTDKVGDNLILLNLNNYRHNKLNL